MFCPKCGTQLPEGAVFCSSCGTKLEIPAPEMTQTPPPGGPQPGTQESFAQTPPPVQPEPQESFAQTPPVEPQPQESFGQTAPEWQAGPQQDFGQTPPPGGYGQPQGFGQVPPQGGYGPTMDNPYSPMAPAKKSKAVPILICVIAAAVIATVVLLFIFVFNKKGGDIVGKYHAAAMEFSGMTLDISSIPGMDANALSFDLQEGGTGTASLNGESHPITWKQEGDTLDIIAEDGKSFADAIANGGGKLEFKNNRIYCTYEQGGMSGSMILAKEGDNLSDIEMTSLAEFLAKMGSSIGQN